MPLATNLIANLKRECAKKNISQVDLAERTGIHATTINRILNGHMTNPTLDLCEKLAAALEFDRPEKLFKQPA
jgi:transcriptional regulator with XRE-family HTH domain